MKNLKRGQSPIPSIGSSVAEGEARKRALTPFLLSLLLATCCWLTAHAAPASYDVILRGGTIYDGSGEKPYTGDVAIRGDRIAAMGDIGVTAARCTRRIPDGGAGTARPARRGARSRAA